MNPFQVLEKPILSEKSTLLRESSERYSFWTKRDASKLDIKHAVEKMFGVNVVSIRTATIRGKYKRRGMHSSLTSVRKKAFVKLGQGQKIKIFEDQ